MWNPFRPKAVEVLAHWYALVPGFNASTQDFYAGVEKEVQERKLSGLEISRVDFAEGGLLSANREYLRMMRERLVFDICAAPFGTSYFFSLRFAEIPSVVHAWQLLVTFFGMFVFLLVLWKIFGFFLGLVLFALLFGTTIWAARNAGSSNSPDLDTALMRLPVLGPIYERFIRKETYYRIDTRLMFLESINAIVKTKVEEFTSAKGIKLLSIKQNSPLFNELYRQVPLHEEPPPM